MAQGACLIVPNNWKTILDKNGIKEAQMSNILQSFLDENGLTSSSLSNVALENTFKNWYSKTFNTEGNIGDLNDKISSLIPNINIEYRVPGNNESDNIVNVVEDKNASSQTLKITFPALNYGAEVSTRLNSVMYNFINSRDEFTDNSIIEQAVNSIKTPRDIAEYLGIRHALINSLGEQDNSKTTKRALELVEYRKKQSPELQYSDHYSQENTSNNSVEVTLDGRGALRTSISPKNATIQSLKKQVGNEEWNNFVERIGILEDQIASYITKTPAAKYYFLKQLEAVQALILRGIYNNNPAVNSFRSLIKTDLDSISLPITSDMLEFAFRRMFGNNNIGANINYDTLIKIQEELNDIKARAVKDGTFMKAPNGKPTNLNEQQWLQVRTKAFKEWFGDWEKVANLDNAIYYHSSNFQFDNFDILNHNNSGNYNSYGYGIHLTSTPNNLEGKHVYQIRVPKDNGNNYLKEGEKKVFNNLVSLADKYGVDLKKFKDKEVNPTLITKYLAEHLSRRDFINLMQESKYDGFKTEDGNVAIIYKDNSAQITNNISKIVDENGEPLVVYHTGASGIASFRTEVYDYNDMPTGIPNAIYTTNSYLASSSYNYAEYLREQWLENEANLGDSHDQDRASVKEAMLLFFDGLLTKNYTNEDDFWKEYTKIHKNRSGFDKWYIYDSYLTYKDFAKDFEKFIVERGYSSESTLSKGRLADEFSEKIFPYPKEPDFSSEFHTYHVFVRMTNPKIVDAKGKEWNKIDYNGKKVSTRDLEHEFWQSEYDGVIVRNVIDYGGVVLYEKPLPHDVFINYYNTYIKSATDNIGTFSKDDNRIDYDTLSEDEESAIITALNINTTPLNVESNTVYGIDKIEELLNKFNSNEVSKQLTNKVLNIAKELGIKVVFTNSLPVGNTGAFTKNTIYLSKNYYENSNNNTKKASTMLHEMIHAISTYALKTEDSKLSKPLQDFKKELRQLFSKLKNNPALKGERGITNEREFIAELANPIFREKLQSIDKDKKKSLWQRIIDTFKKLFGIQSSDPYYTRMMNTLDKAINAFDAKTYREYNSRNKEDYDTFIKKSATDNNGDFSKDNDDIDYDTVNNSSDKESTIIYTPKGKKQQTYTIRGTHIFNKSGNEVFKEDTADRRSIFANLAVAQGRAVIVEHKGKKYVVNRKDQIISVTSKKEMKRGNENGDRKAILTAAHAKFSARSRNAGGNTISTQSVSTPQAAKLPTKDDTINIYYSNGENRDLSNFYKRTFEAKNSPINGHFDTVEGAFQAQKLSELYNSKYTDSYYKSEGKTILNKLRNADGYTAKKLGRTIEGLKRAEWDRDSSSIMKSLLWDSFEQNPDDAKRLLATGDARLTHTQDQGYWGTEFPKLLMEVRDELRAKHPEWMPNAQAQQNITTIPVKRTPVKTVKMTYFYGNKKLDGVKSNTTFDAIVNGERTATTRYLEDKHIDYWKELKVGDVVEFEDERGHALYVEITVPLHKLDKNTTAEEWCKKEGWSKEHFNNKVKPQIDKGEAYQIEFKYIANSLYDKPNHYTGMITPDDNTIFVFGSNPEGRHGDGAAKAAVDKFGAKYGQGEGLQGNAYALPTKDLRVKENNSLRSISSAQITENIKKLYEVAKQHPNKQFKVAYTNKLDEATRNGYTGREMIKMFKDAGPIPINVIFSKVWTDHWNEVTSDRAQQRQAIQSVVEGSESSTQPAGSTLISNGSLRANVKTEIDTTTPLYKLSMQLTPVQFYRRKDTIATWFNQNAEWNAKLFKEDIDKRLKNLAEGDEGKLKLERIKVSLEDIDNFIRNAIPYIINDWEDIEGKVHKGIIRETKGNIETALYGDSNKKASDEEGNAATYDSIEEGLDAEGLSYLDKIKDKDWNDEEIKDAVIRFLSNLDLCQTEEVDVRTLREQFQILYDNFDLLFKETLPIIETRNNVKLSFNDESTTTDQTDETDKIDTSDNDNLTEDTNGNKATGADGYGIKVRQQDPAKTMRAVTRRILSNIEDVDPSGETKYDDLGMPIHLREAWVHTVLMNECSAIVDKPDDFVIKDEDGNYDFPALNKLEEKYPWVSEIKNRLWDNKDAISALYADVGAKVFMPVYTQKIIEQRDSIGGATRTSFPVNAKASEISILNTADSLYRGGEKTYIVSEPNSTESLTIWDMYGVPNKSNIEKVTELIKDTLDLLNKQEEYKNGERVDQDTINANFDAIYRNLADALTSIGIIQSVNVVAGAMTASDVSKTKNKIKYTIDSISLIIDKFSKWKTKDLVGKNSLVTSYNSAYKKIADNLGTVSETYNNTTFRQQGKSYPSYVNPNYIDNMVKTIHTGEHIEEFLKEEFGYDEFFYDSDNKKFRSPWLQLFTRVIERDEYLGKKTINIGSEVRRNFTLKHIYDMDTIPYSKWTKDQIMCNFLHEYFQGVVVQDGSNEYEYAYYALPPLSDTEIAVFVKAPKVTTEVVQRGEDLMSEEEATKKVKERLLPYFVDVAKQELVRMRRIADRASNGARQISNYDTENNKKEFLYFPHLNDILVSKDDNGEFTALTETEIGAQGLDKNDFVKVLDYIESINESKNKEQLTDKVLKAALDKTLADDSQEFYESLAGLKEPVSDQKIIGDGGMYNRDSIEEFYLNNALAQINIIQLFATDLSFTKNYTDFVKRIKEIYASGTKLNTNSKYGRKIERSIYLKDKIVTSNSYTRVRASLNFAVDKGYITEQVKKSLLSKWKKINATDAQAYRTASSFRAILDMLGRWSPDKQDAITRLANGEGSSEDFYVTFDTIKPFLFANVKVPTGLNDANGNPTFMRAPMHHKDSEIMLLAFIQLLENAENSNGRKTSTLFAKSPQLTALNEFMEKHDIDVALFESAVKCGCSGIIDINFTEDIKKRRAAAKKLLEIRDLRDKLREENIKDYNSITSDFPDCYAIKRCADVALDNYMLTQPEYNDLMDSLAPSYEEVKNILERSIVPKNGNPNNDTLTSRGELQDVVHEVPYDYWMEAQPTSGHLVDAKSIYGSQAKYLVMSDIPDDAEFEIKTKSQTKSMKGKDILKLYNSLFVENLIEDFGKASTPFTNIKELQKKLLKMLKTNPSYGMDMVNALDLVVVDGKPQFNIPLFNSTASNKVEQLINSIFKNNVGKQYINGGACVLMSNFGFDNNLKIIRDENGAITGFECYLPASTKKLFWKFMRNVYDKKGNIIGKKIDIDRVKKECPEILEGIGYRIPTEGKYSMANFIVKGFLPQQCGAAIMMPAELTLLSGSDFDIDKLYIMLKAFEVGEDGIPRVIEYDLNKSPQEQSRKARNNMLIDIMRAILSSKYVSYQINHPGNYEHITGESFRTKILNNRTLQEKWKEIHGEKPLSESLLNADYGEMKKFIDKYEKKPNPLSLATYAYYHHQNMVGKELVAIYALNTTMQGKYQQTNLGVAPYYQFTINGFNVSSLHEKERTYYDSRGNVIRKALISSNNEEFSAASVDNVKDPRLADLGQTKENAYITNAMVRMGIDIKELGLFTALPFYRLNSEGYFAVARDYGVSIDRYNSGDLYITSKELMEINEYLRNKDPEEPIDDAAMKEKVKRAVNIMYRITKVAEHLEDLTFISRPDSPNGAIDHTLAGALKQVFRVDDFLNKEEREHILTGYEILVNNLVKPTDSVDDIREAILTSPIPILTASYTLGIQLPLDMIATQFPQINKQRRDFLQELKKQYKYEELSKNIISKYVKEAVVYGMSRADIFTATDEKGNDVTPAMKAFYLVNYPQIFRTIKSNSKFAQFEVIRAMMVDNNGDIVIPNMVDLKGFRETAIRDLNWMLAGGSEHDSDITNMAIDLFRYSYFKDGLGWRPSGFSSLFDSLFLSSIPSYLETIRKLTFDGRDGLDWNKFDELFTRNHPTMIYNSLERLAPSFGKTPPYVVDEQTGKIYVEAKPKSVGNGYVSPVDNKIYEGQYKRITYKNELYEYTDSMLNTNGGISYVYTKVPSFNYNNPCYDSNLDVDEQIAITENAVAGAISVEAEIAKSIKESSSEDLHKNLANANKRRKQLQKEDKTAAFLRKHADDINKLKGPGSILEGEDAWIFTQYRDDFNSDGTLPELPADLANTEGDDSLDELRGIINSGYNFSSISTDDDQALRDFAKKASDDGIKKSGENPCK